MEKINKLPNGPVNIKQIIDDAKADPSLLSNLDINSLLNAIDEKNTDYLENKTLKDINQDVFDTINEQNFGQGAFTPPTTNFKGDHRSPEKFGDTAREKMIKSLLGYRYVSEIYELHLGKAVQIIKKKNDVPRLIIAGFITNIEFLDNGIYFVCKGFKNRMFKYKFDDCHIFQKLSQSEMLILMAYDSICSSV